jgi:hypothetical protein
MEICQKNCTFFHRIDAFCTLVRRNKTLVLHWGWRDSHLCRGIETNDSREAFREARNPAGLILVALSGG